MRVTIGGTSRDWWSALHSKRDAGEMPAALEPIANGSDGEVTVPMNEWKELRTWGESLSGWRERDGSEQLTAEESF